MTSTLMPESTAPVAALPDWGVIGDRLVAAFPGYPAKEVLAEIVHAHEAALYVGTPEHDLADVVEFMAIYAMKVRSGQVSPSGRIAPESRTPSPREINSDE